MLNVNNLMSHVLFNVTYITYFCKAKCGTIFSTISLTYWSKKFLFFLNEKLFEQRKTNIVILYIFHLDHLLRRYSSKYGLAKNKVPMEITANAQRII